MHAGIDESKSHSSESQNLSTTQDYPTGVTPIETNKMSSPSATTTFSVETEIGLCPCDFEGRMCSPSCRENTYNPTANANNCIDTGTEKYTNSAANAEKMDSIDPKHINSHSTSKAPYDLNIEPVEGGSYTSCSSLLPSGHSGSLDSHITEESLFPPLLQRTGVDMPLLTPEPIDKAGICHLPPVLTQEMPSLTLADDGLSGILPSTSHTHWVAPVLQRETPIDSPSSSETKREGKESEKMTSKEMLTEAHTDSWHLDSPYQCEAAVPDFTGNIAHLTTNTMNKITPGDVHEMLTIPEIAVEEDHTKRESLTHAQSDASPSNLLQSTEPQKEQPNLAELTSKVDDKDIALSRSLMTGSSNNNPPASFLQSCTQKSAVHLHQMDKTPLQHTTFSPSSCTSQNPYIEPKPFSNNIWKNLNSHSPAVLIQSLNPELPSDFAHDPLPYTMWTEPQCKEVTDLEDTEQDLQEHQGEGCGPLTWAQLEPTSLISASAAEPLGICGDYDLHRVETDGAEALVLCTELEREREAEGGLEPDTAVSPLGLGGGEQDGVSDMEEGVSEGEEEEQLSSAKEESSSDSSEEDEDEEEEEEEEEENDTSSHVCDESGLEPGEVCAVSIPSHTI